MLLYTSSTIVLLALMLPGLDLNVIITCQNCPPPTTTAKPTTTEPLTTKAMTTKGTSTPIPPTTTITIPTSPNASTTATVKPTTVKPTTSERPTPSSTTVSSTTATSTTVKPTTMKPTTSERTTPSSTTVSSTTAKSTTVKPTTMKPTTRKRTTPSSTTVSTTTTTAKSTTTKTTTVSTTMAPTTEGSTTPIGDVCPKVCKCSTKHREKIVDCSNAMLQDVPRGIPKDTNILDLSSNSITLLDGNNSALQNLTELRLLFLMSNTLTIVEAGAFEGCGKLSEIHFSNNSLGNNGIQPGVFNDTANHMYYLYFERNGMNENVSPDMFKGMKSIEGIYFSNNNFTVLKRGMFKYTNSLVDVRFEYNNLKIIEDGVWNDVTSLTTMDLRFNDFNSLNYQMFKGLINMDQLYILRCPLVNGIEDGTFQDMTKLTFLTLEGNGLAKLSPYLLKGLAHLSTLWLYGNAIEAIDGAVFQYSPLLETVLLWDNVISQVTGSIQNLSNLKEFDLSTNEIKTLKDGFFPKNVKSNLTIDLRRNPLHCNCFFNWTAIPMRSKTITVKGICETPRKLSGRDITKMGKFDFVCHKPFITSVTGNITVSVGSNVTVSCTAEGDPLPTIVWEGSSIGVRKEIGPPSDDALLSNDGTLTITNFSQAYEGNYICSAQNDVAIAMRTITVRIGPDHPSSKWNITFWQFVGCIIGAILITFVCTSVVFLIIWYFKDKKTGGYQFVN